MTKDEALRLALEALEDYQEHIHRKKTQSAITAIKAILAPRNELETHWNEMRASYGARQAALEAKDEPVAWMFQHEETGRTMCVDAQQLEWGFEKGNPRLKKIAPLYTTPPQRKPLTDEEIAAISKATHFQSKPITAFARAIEAAHGIKGEA